MDYTLKQKNNQQGFTLIELIIVIVILGILAVTAAPKFLNLTGDTHRATLNSMVGTLKSASGLVYSKSIIQGVNKLETGSVDINGDGTGDINTEYGYPSDERATGITLAMSDDFAEEWAWSTRNGPQRVVLTSAKLSPSGAGQKINNVPITTGDCFITYIAPTAEGDKPSITATLTGCD